MAGLAPTFPDGYDSDAEAAGIWQSFHLHNGQENAHLLIRYIEDRREDAERWTQALRTTDVPLIFVWGMLDPVSGARMAERIREQLPDAPSTTLEDDAHWPPLEAPERVVAAVCRRQRGGPARRPSPMSSSSARQALRRSASRRSRGAPDVVVMDWSTPGMNGIRRQPNFGGGGQTCAWSASPPLTIGAFTRRS